MKYHSLRSIPVNVQYIEGPVLTEKEEKLYTLCDKAGQLLLLSPPKNSQVDAKDFLHFTLTEGERSAIRKNYKTKRDEYEWVLAILQAHDNVNAGILAHYKTEVESLQKNSNAQYTPKKTSAEKQKADDEKEKATKKPEIASVNSSFSPIHSAKRRAVVGAKSLNSSLEYAQASFALWQEEQALQKSKELNPAFTPSFSTLAQLEQAKAQLKQLSATDTPFVNPAPSGPYY